MFDIGASEISLYSSDKKIKLKPTFLNWNILEGFVNASPQELKDLYLKNIEIESLESKYIALARIIKNMNAVLNVSNQSIELNVE